MQTRISIPAFLSTAVLCLTASTAFAQQSLQDVAPDTGDVERVWHLGRVTGDLERIIAFYHDVLGLGFRGDRAAPIPFYSVAAINEFVDAPAHAEFRAAFMPIPGTSLATDPAQQIYLEAFEYRNIDRVQRIPALSDPGASSLRFFVRDLDAMLAAAKDANVSIITQEQVPVTIPAPRGVTGNARAIMLRDPDGYAVELVEVSPIPDSIASADSSILGAQISVVVTDADAAYRFYQQLLGENTRGKPPGAWSTDANVARLRNLASAEYRSADIALPGSSIALELIEFRGLPQTPYRPVFQDIGFGHIALITKDIETTFEQMQELGMQTLSKTGSWTQINANLRAVYTRDNDGFFIEIIDNL